MHAQIAVETERHAFEQVAEGNAENQRRHDAAGK